jgi:hypothetical protein
MRYENEANPEERPRVETHFGKWEIHINSDIVEICCGANQTIVIDKMYGPLSAYPVRVTLKYDKDFDGDWVVEYQNPTTEKWEVKARWSCQENWKDYNAERIDPE